MSNKKFFRKITTAIALWFNRLFARAKSIAEKVIPVGIDVVENIKLVMDSPVPDVLTALIPGNVDDMVAAQIRRYLPGILLKLKLSDECARKGTNDEIVQCAIEHLKQYHPEAKKAYYLAIASMLSSALADGKLTWAEIVMLTQFTKDNKTAL